jgi:hypothetical protein
MHRTRVFGFFIDAPLDAADAAVRFWSGALGTATRTEPGDPFTRLVDALPGDIALEVQAVDDAPRYHLDIEPTTSPRRRRGWSRWARRSSPTTRRGRSCVRPASPAVCGPRAERPGRLRRAVAQLALSRDGQLPTEL